MTDKINQGFVYDSNASNYQYEASGEIKPVELSRQRTNMTYDVPPLADEPTIVEMRKPEHDREASS